MHFIVHTTQKYLLYLVVNVELCFEAAVWCFEMLEIRFSENYKVFAFICYSKMISTEVLKYNILRIYKENRAIILLVWKLARHIINQQKQQHLDWEMQRPMFSFTIFSARILSTILKDFTPKSRTTETLAAFLSLLWAIKLTKFIVIWAHLVCEIRERNEKKWKKQKEVFFIKFNKKRLMRKLF